MKNIAIVFLILISLALKAQVIPTYETFSLKNGLKVYLLQYGNIPAINVKLVLNSGKVNETPGQQNYSDIVSNAILMGNAKYDAELTQPENKVDDKKALDAKHTLYHREDFPEFQANTRTPETKKLLDYLAQVLEVPPYNGDIDSGTYVSWLNEHATAGTNDTPARQGLTNIKLSLNAPREVFDLIANYEAELAALEENKKTETIQPNTHEILNTGDTFEKGTTQAQLEEKEKVINLLRGINIKDEKKLRNILTTQIPNVYESTDVDTSRKLALALQQLANEYNFDIKDLT